MAGSNVTEEGLDLMQIYKAVIAARNNVRGARSGSNADMKGITINFWVLLKRGGEINALWKWIIQGRNPLSADFKSAQGEAPYLTAHTVKI